MISALEGVKSRTTLPYQTFRAGCSRCRFGPEPGDGYLNARKLSNTYFANGDAKATMHTPSAHPNGMLVSEEMVKNFQLSPADRLNLRLWSANNISAPSFRSALSRWSASFQDLRGL